MQDPYFEANEEIRRKGELPVKLGKTALSLGASVATGTALARVTPFLSKYIPEDLAIKGLSKIDPRFGKFITTALAGGQTMDQIKDFIGQKAEEGEAEEGASLLDKYDPMINRVITYLMDNKGLTPRQAAVHAEVEPKLRDVIQKIKKDFGTKDFAEIVEKAYVNYKRKNANESPEQQPIQQAQQATQAPQQAGQLPPQIVDRMQNAVNIMKQLRGG